MLKLNSMVINSFLRRNYPAIAIQPFSIFIKDRNEFEIESFELIEKSLEIGLTPILFGDVVLDKEKGFSIISGDIIILELCKLLKKSQVSKVIFAIEKDGIFVEEERTMKLLNEINISKIDTLKLASLDKKIDVTGGIKGKLEIVKQIGALNIPVQILNGLKKENIYKGIMNQNIKSTVFFN
jgi:isopentenyl phosphate kinase